MKQNRITVALVAFALALAIFLILTVLPLTGTAAARLERQPLESPTALNAAEAAESATSSSAFRAPSAASVVQYPGTTTRVYAALRSAAVMFIKSVGQFADGARFRVRGGIGTMSSYLEERYDERNARQASTFVSGDALWLIASAPGLRPTAASAPAGILELLPLSVLDGVIIYAVQTTNVRDTTFNVSWMTNQSVTGEVHYGTDPASLDQTVYDDRGLDTFDDTHYVTLLGLAPETTYYFDVVSDGTTDDNGGAHYSVTTGPTLDLPSVDTIYGQVFKEDGTTLAEGTIVYIMLQDADGSGNPGEAAPLSTLVDSSGYWYTDLGNARTSDLSAYFEYSAGGDSVMLLAMGAAEGCASQTVDTSADTPAPPMTLTLCYLDYSISGTVSGQNGNPIAGVTVSAGVSGSDTTDANGDYNLTGLGSGTYTLTPSKSDYSFSPARRTVNVPPDVTGQDFIGVADGGPPTPFLDLPFDYDGGSPSALLNGRVTSWFDHEYPDYSEDDGIWLYNQEKAYTKNRTEPQPGIFCYENHCYDGHNGIDFARPKNDDEPWPVLAAASGIVTYINPIDAGGLGKYVVLYHDVDQGNAYYTYYAHLHGISVTIGITVTSHYTLGMAGNSGNGKGHHLHFEVHRDDGDQVWEPSEDKAVDPHGWKSKAVPDPWVENSGFPSYWLWLHDPAQKKTAAGDEGTVITDTAGSIQATISPGAFSGQATFELSPGPVAVPSAQLRSSGHSFWLRLLEWLPGSGSLQSAIALQNTTQFTLTKPITLTVAYTDTDLLHLDESLLALYRWDEEQETWHPLTTTVDTVQNVVMAQTQDLGEFDLQTSLLCTTDELEPDDDYQAAHRVWPNDWPLARGLDVPEDSDWVSLQAVHEVTYTISTRNLVGGVDTVLNLYDADAVTLLASNDDAGGGPASELVWTAPYTGTFFVETVSAPGGTTDCSATYELTIATIPGDVVADCRVDIADIMQVASQWRCKCGNACYHSVYDLDGDCDIDIVDIMLVVVHWGETCW